MQRSQLYAANRGEGLGSLAQAAEAVRAAGTHGDTVLAHISPKEARLLDFLADRKVDYPVNPETGLPTFGDGDGTGTSGDGNTGMGGGGTVGGSVGGPGGSIGGPSGGPSGGGSAAAAPSTGFDLSDASQFTGPESEIGMQSLGNPEMGGGFGRARGLASVAALGPKGSMNVNAASSVMKGEDVSWTDRFNDFRGQDAPGGFPSSPAATLGLGLLGTAIGGPVLGTGLSLAHEIGVRGVSAPEAIGSSLGGLVAGAPGSLAGGLIGQEISGKETYEAPMTENDRARRNAELDEAERTGAPPGGRTAGAETGRTEGSGAGTGYLMPAPAAAKRAAARTGQPADGWDEKGFLARHPEVAEAVGSGTWTSGRAFDQAYRAAAGASYDAAKAIGLVDASGMLNARPFQAVFTGRQ